MRAIISVANRDGLMELGRELQSHEVAIFSTSGTLKALQTDGLSAESVSKLTNFPEILDGRVKTLHPAILGGILARRDLPKHEEFTETVARPETTLEEAQEQIDIGGVTLVRAAAKNFQDVIVLVRPEDYVPVMQEWREQGEVSLETRRRLAAIAFQHTASYDSAIAEYLRIASGDLFPEQLTLPLERVQSLRYGENPHQHASFYRWSGVANPIKLPSIATSEVLHGKELSYNNLLDLDAALGAVQSFTAPTVAIIKHTNPCGLACDDTLVDAYKRAYAGDPISAFGGIIGCNRPVDEATAHEIVEIFAEAVIAPEFTPRVRRHYITGIPKCVRSLADYSYKLLMP